jgi:hypothetical protein
VKELNDPRDFFREAEEIAQYGPHNKNRDHSTNLNTIELKRNPSPA